MDLYRTKEKVREYALQYRMIEEGDCILVGVSGGADSICLLLVLLAMQDEYELKLKVVHVEHGMREVTSQRDADFVEAFCKEKGIPCQVRHIDVPALAKADGIGEEECARKYRYAILKEEADKWQPKVKVAVAHNKNDQAETFLFQLVRGAGLEGLSGIAPVKADLIRPLLCLERGEIEDCLAQEGQTYCHDETNDDIAFSRNRVRHEVLPELTLVNAQAVAHIARSADVMAHTADFLRIQIDQAYQECLEEDRGVVRINVEKLDQLHTFLKAEVIRKALAEAAVNKKDLSSIHIDTLTRLAGLQTGRSADLPYGVTARREYDTIVLKKDGGAEESGYEAEELPMHFLGDLDEGVSFDLRAFGCDFRFAFTRTLPGPEQLKNDWKKYFDYDKIKDGLVIRAAKEGDYLVIDSLGRKKKLNRYFIDSKVPQSARGRLPLLADGDHIIWVIGGRISEAYKVTPETKRIIQVEALNYERKNYCHV